MHDAFKPTKPQSEPPSDMHLYGLKRKFVCGTQARGEAREIDFDEIVVDASEGFVPLWAENTVLHWRLRRRSFDQFVERV